MYTIYAGKVWNDEFEMSAIFDNRQCSEHILAWSDAAFKNNQGDFGRNLPLNFWTLFGLIYFFIFLNKGVREI